MNSADLVRATADLVESVLYPAAMSVDAARVIPPAHLDALAAAGLYGIAGPAQDGGLAADPATFCRVVEIMASGCLATTFVWLQHHGAVRAVAASPAADLRATWLRPLIEGRQRAGVALVGGWPGPPRLRARAVPGGYQLDGTAPWVTGWGMVDVIYTVARADDGNLVAALVPARASASLAAASLDLVAVNAAATVELTFTRHPVSAAMVCSVSPHAEWLATDSRGLRPNGSLALGVAARCCLLADQPALARQLSDVRDRLNGADPDAMPAARAAAAEFAFLAAGAAVTAAGSRGILVGEHPQRLAREAQFLLVFGSRPAIKEHLLGLLTGG